MIGIIVHVTLNYWQLMRAFPEGGGSPEAAGRAFGEEWSFLPIGALVVDFALTIAISIAAASCAVIAYLAGLASDRIPLALALTALVAGPTWFGHSGRMIFAVMTWSFIITAIRRHRTRGRRPLLALDRRQSTARNRGDQTTRRRRAPTTRGAIRHEPRPGVSFVTVSREVWSACMESRLDTTRLQPASGLPRDRAGAMRRVPGTAARARGAPPRSASAVLGSDHPLARATDALDSVVRQSLAVAAVLVGSIIDLLAGLTWAATLAASAAIVLVGLTVIATACRQTQRDRALALILEGRENVPVAAVQRQRRRLLDPRTRATLARNLAVMIEQASTRRGFQACRICPLFDRAVIRAVADDLRAVIRLLGSDHAPVRGVAVVEHLLTDAFSPLYGNQAEPLRQELHRIGHLLTP